MQEYKAKEKTVNKMSRDGLTEENLHSQASVRISKRETDALSLPGQAVDSVNFQEMRNHGRTESKERRRRKNYHPNFQKVEGEQDFSEMKEHPSAFQNSDGERTSPEVLEGESDGGEESKGRFSESSARMRDVRGHPSGKGRYISEKAAEVFRSGRKKKQAQEYFRKERESVANGENHKETFEKETFRYYEKPGTADLPEVAEQPKDSVREEIKKKQKREQLHKEQKKQASRLSFGNENQGMVHGAGTGIARKTVSVAADSITGYVHEKGHEAEQENVAVEGAHKAEILAESSLRHMMRNSSRRMQEKHFWKNEAEGESGSRLQFHAGKETGEAVGKQAADAEQAKKTAVKKFWQKQRIKQSYQAARKGEETIADTAKATQSLWSKAKRVVWAFFKENKGFLGAAVVIMLLFLMVSAAFSSCSSMAQGAASSVIGTTYPSKDEDIYAVEDAYRELEEALNRQINQMESAHPGYEEYWYQVDEISHNPYHLISYFTAKYGEFTYRQVAGEIEEIFREQYGLYVNEVNETVTETKTVRVGESLGEVMTSAYCSCPICCGIWSGGPTASGVYPTANHTIAVDAQNPFVPMGTKVIMNGVEYVVEDTGAFARFGVQFDVYYDDHTAAQAHGHQKWEAYIADANGSREVEVTTTEEINRLETTLTNHSLDAVLRSRMDENEEKRYDLYNLTFGNRDYLFDRESLPGGADGGFGYEIPSEALSDEKFANMIREAEKYLGFPYVWGGASPSTSFDCSGFVSWVINNCGNGWNVGRQTAEGLRGCCAYVSPSEAKPGDLIFFQGTYETAGASHIGIYVGNNMMIHCGDPIQYANIATPYWQEHFMAYGRIR